MNTKSALILASVLSIQGCAATIPRIDKSMPVPAARIKIAESAAENRATVVVVRNNSFAGGGVGYELVLDGKPAAKIGSGEFTTFLVEPGQHLLEVRHPSQSLGAIGDSKSIDAKDRAAYYFYIASDLGQIKLIQTTGSALGAP